MKHHRVMRYSARNILFLFLFFFFIPCRTVQAAEESIYTIQTGSFTELSVAEGQYEILSKGLTGPAADKLRIEKVGKYYCIRIGKFPGESEAGRVIASVKALVPSAIIMKAYYKEERIVKPALRAAPAEPAQPEIKRTEPPRTKPLKEESKQPAQPLPEEEAVQPAPGEDKGQIIRDISAMVKKGDTRDALDTIRSEIRTNPEDPDLNGWYGVVLLKMNDPNGGLKYFRKAAELSPGVADFHNGAAYCLFYLNRFSEAIEEFNTATAILPSHTDAIAGLGITYLKVGKKTEAMEMYKRLLPLDRETAARFHKILQSTR